MVACSFDVINKVWHSCSHVGRLKPAHHIFAVLRSGNSHLWCHEVCRREACAAEPLGPAEAPGGRQSLPNKKQAPGLCHVPGPWHLSSWQFGDSHVSAAGASVDQPACQFVLQHDRYKAELLSSTTREASAC